MQVIGFNFTKIEAERKKDINNDMKIASNISMKSITQEKLDIVKDQVTLKFDFVFGIDYTKDIAEIKFSGFILVLTDKSQAKEVLKQWKKKKIPDEARIPLFNYILQKCNLRALQFEEEFGLPPHIPLPRIDPNKKDNNRDYAG